MEYISLIRKSELINFYKYGWMFPYFPSVKVEFGIEELPSHPEIGMSLLNMSNPLDYSIEGFILLHTTENVLDETHPIRINQVEAVYALDIEAYNIGFHLSPEIKLSEPLWENVYSDFCVQMGLKDANIGVENIFKIFGIDPLKKPPFKIEMNEVLSNIYSGIAPCGKRSIWYYLYSTTGTIHTLIATLAML